MDNKEGVKEVSPLRVLLGAVELAQSRGAFRMSEMNLITQAYNMLSEAENKQNPQPENKVLENDNN
jgi:hypothetical protein